MGWNEVRDTHQTWANVSVTLKCVLWNTRKMWRARCAVLTPSEYDRHFTHDVQRVLVPQNFGRLSISRLLLPQLRFPSLLLDLLSFHHLGVDEINWHLILQLLLYQCCHHSEIRTTGNNRLMWRTTTWNGLHPRLCLNSSRNHMLHPLHIVTRSGKFVIMSSSRFVVRLTTVQTLCSLTNQVHELQRLDRISVSHQVNLSTQFTSLYFVMMSCYSELPTFRRRLQ